MNSKFKSMTLAALIAIASVGKAGTASAQQYRDRGDHRTDNRGDRNLDHDNRGRWSQRQHNGYYVGNRFYYGQPNAAQKIRGDYPPAWQQWRRSDRLLDYGRRDFRQVDSRREHLRQPPRGYHYVRDDRGEVLLVAVATGVILSILLNN